MQRQLATRRATLEELIRENLMSATHSVLEEISVLEAELREALAAIHLDGKSIQFGVDAGGGRRGWYREEQLARASREQAEASRKREIAVEDHAMELFGSLSTGAGGSLHGEHYVT